MGGRDDKLLRLIAEKLNFRYDCEVIYIFIGDHTQLRMLIDFRYKYIDPPERIQGSSFSANGTFEGVLGLIWRRVFSILDSFILIIYIYSLFIVMYILLGS